MDLATFLVAVVPAFLIVGYIYKKDKKEHEPIGLLIKLFFLGVLSIFPAVLFEMAGERIEIMFMPEVTMLRIFVDNFLVVAVAEELFKLLALRLGSWKNKNFDYTYDAIVYAVCVGIGFAVPETLLYVLDGGMSLAILRSLTSIPGHISFAVYMGYYMGQAKACAFVGDLRGQKRFMRKAFWIPVLLHGFFDFCLTSQKIVALIVFVIFVICLDVFALKLVKRASRDDRRIDPRPHIFINDHEFAAKALISKDAEGCSYLVCDLAEQGSWVAQQFTGAAEGEPGAGTFDTASLIKKKMDGYDLLCRAGIPVPMLREVDYERKTLARDFIAGVNAERLQAAGNLTESMKDQIEQMRERSRAAGFEIASDLSQYVVQADRVYYVSYNVSDLTAAGTGAGAYGAEGKYGEGQA